MSVHAENWQVHPGVLGPGTEVGSWRVVERLGVGGYGAVYRVEDMARPGDFYAMKMALRPGDERAEREVQLLMSKAMHPNVVRLHATGRWPHPQTGYLYFVMDWVPGLALHTWVETVNPTFRQLAEVVGKVALALGALHDKGVLHRDFKPEHVLIRERDVEPILLDFGVGRYAGADTVTTAVLPPATLHLLSPEAVRFFRKHYERPGARYEARATDDLYALGVSLYRVVTGHWPFSPELPPDMLYAAVEGRVPPAPAAFNRRMPRAFSDVIMRLLAKKPESRFQTGHEVRDELVAAVTFGTPDEWGRSVFEWEGMRDAAGVPGGARRIRRPEWPTASKTFPPRKLVLGPFLSMPGLRVRRSRAELDRGPAPEPFQQRRRRWPYSAGLVAALALGLWVTKVLGWWPGAPPSKEIPAASRVVMANEPVRSSGYEVALQVESSETATAAAPLLVASTPAAAAPATHVEDQTAVKTLKTAFPPTTPAMNAKAPALRTVGKVLCMGATSAALACTGPQVRPAPPSESCPPGAEGAMERLGIGVGEIHPLKFPGTQRQVISVREGYTEWEVIGEWEGLPYPTRLSGRLVFGDGRVYGRLTEARTPKGERIPVCMVLYGTDLKLGLLRKPGGGANTAQVFSVGTVKAVERFD
ncbi:serine/threonine-protein kinase [Myxococcus sp. RHSTA-1-4]|uniref:serine/threonine protein kinase n=1 Tax=Myxococcus sp. RHSTA-1-4 TaxID=2874601 RepID=UPI001CBFC821|nr:serine/threonine-protein kinase [Myxococcus sp. RHSTA-1-4]MBZ4421762.1 serine/threonine protein kinase [Myxococcus sp. RHSTA-1-4]